MAVNANRSGSLLLAVFEKLAVDQPLGVRHLARLLEADKSSVQRALATLADAGWAHTARGTPTRWQLTGRIHQLARTAHDSNGLRLRARPALGALRDATGETICLAVPDGVGFVIVEVAESRVPLRSVPPTGFSYKTKNSATGLSILAYLSAQEQIEIVGGPLDEDLKTDLKLTLEKGYYARVDDRSQGSVNVAAPIFEIDGTPIASILLSAPRERAGPEDYERLGKLVSATARDLSLSLPKRTGLDFLA